MQRVLKFYRDGLGYETDYKDGDPPFWGGYHAYFADPDGYYRDVAWGPGFKFDEDGLRKFN